MNSGSREPGSIPVSALGVTCQRVKRQNKYQHRRAFRANRAEIVVVYRQFFILARSSAKQERFRSFFYSAIFGNSVLLVSYALWHLTSSWLRRYGSVVNRPYFAILERKVALNYYSAGLLVSICRLEFVLIKYKNYV